LLEEAGAVACVTDRACGLSLYEKGIAIAILGDGLQSEEIARCFSLVPQLLPAAAIEPNVSSGQRALERFFTHVAQHQDFIGPGILGNGWNQAFIVELQHVPPGLQAMIIAHWQILLHLFLSSPGLKTNPNVKTQMTIEIQMLKCQRCIFSCLDFGLDLAFELCHLILVGMWRVHDNSAHVLVER
jgi:hypothetical protein